MRALAGAAVVLILLAGCRSPAPRAMSLAEVVPPGTAGFALDPIPTPVRARLLDRVLPAGPGVLRVLEEDLPGADPEAYVLEIGEHGGETVVRVAAGGEAGRRWAAATLRQLVVRFDGRDWIRAGRIEDAPALPLRGSKRPLRWEWVYKANLAYEKGGDASWRAEVGRVEFVPVHSPGGVLDATETGVEAAAAFFDRGRARGARRFSIEFDDVGFGLTPASEERFGAYPRALKVYLAEVRARLAALDPEAVLYWLPQTYWTDDPRLPVFARDLGLAGGLPPDMGLVVTGPQVISAEIAAADVAEARRRFGLTRTKALVYDNRGREGDHGPLAGRDPALVTQVDGVFGERGEILNRITRLDWNWNPLAYDPVRSHLLACRELAGAAAAPALSRLIREGGSLPGPERRRLAAEVRAKLDPPPGREGLGDARACVERILFPFEVEP